MSSLIVLDTISAVFKFYQPVLPNTNIILESKVEEPDD